MTTYLPHLPTPPIRKPVFGRALPSGPVRLAIAIHKPTEGKHRLRFLFDRDTAHKLARGLKHPRLHIDGDCGHGFRVTCRESGGYAPITSGVTGSYCAVPVRRVKGREAPVATTPVEHYWDSDEHGPVLVIPRPPDAFLPQPLLDKLPKSQLEPETAMRRAFSQAERRLEREMAAALDETKHAVIQPFPHGVRPLDTAELLNTHFEPPPAVRAGRFTEWATGPHPLPALDPDEVDPLEPEPEDLPGEPDPEPDEPEFDPDFDLPDPDPEETRAARPDAVPLPAPLADLKTAVTLVNELVDTLGADVSLWLDSDGRLQARRRIVTYVDL